MYIINLLTILYLIINISVYANDDGSFFLDLDEGIIEINHSDSSDVTVSSEVEVPDNLKCAVIYIPEESLQREGQDINMILFVNNNPSYGESRGDYRIDDDDFFISKAIRYGDDGQTVNYPAIISGGKKIIFGDDENVNPIQLDNNNESDHICRPNYQNRELRVLDSSNHLIGYAYRNENVDYNNFSEYKLDSFVRYAAEVVVADETRYKKRSKYLFSCITGNNNDVDNIECYQLIEKDARKAYVTKPYKLYSTTDNKFMKVKKKLANWIISENMYFHHRIKPEEISTFTYSPCYKMRKTRKVMNGRVLFISDGDRQILKDMNVDDIRTYFIEHPSFYNSPSCST